MLKVEMQTFHYCVDIFLGGLAEHGWRVLAPSSISHAGKQSNSQKGRQLCHLLVFLCRYKHQSAAILAAETKKITVNLP
jgi:hypothetical protein